MSARLVAPMTPGARVAALCLLPLFFVPSQQRRDGMGLVAAGTAEISGTVVTSGAVPVPVRRATIRLSSAALGSSSLTTVTDDAGQFTCRSLPPGRYTLTAAKGGYLPAAYGTNRPGGVGTPITVGEQQRVAGITLRLLKGSVITGMVRDDRGRPVPEVTVSVLQKGWDATTGEPTLDSPRFGAPQVTDDRGTYRQSGLAPGEYVVSARWPTTAANAAPSDLRQMTPADVQWAQQLLRQPGGVVGVVPTIKEPASLTVAYTPVFYPAAVALADAATITLGPERELSGIDLQMRMAHPARIEGVTLGPDGAPMADVKLNLLDGGPSLHPGEVAPLLASTHSEQDGTFVMSGVAPGRYVIEAIGISGGGTAVGAGATQASLARGVAEVAVDGLDVTTSIALSLGGQVSGRVVFEGTSVPPDVTAVPLVLRQRPLISARSAAPRSDGTFVLTNVATGTYRLTLRQRAPVEWMGWMLKSVMVRGVDVSDIPFEVGPGENVENAVVTFTDRHTEITGTLLNAAGQAAPDYVLIVYSSDKRFWVAQTRRTPQVRPGADGTFVIRDLPPGDYFINAVTDVEDGEWNDPAFLAELASHQPVKVTLADGEKKVQDIKVGAGS